jgi:acyl-homoserine-lactone acylase
MKKLLLLIFLPSFICAQSWDNASIQRWEKQAERVKIVRDKWGVPHIYGKSDADAVFGLLYAQCEDDFKRVEMNYIEKLGRISEVKGESELYKDLLIRMIIDSTEAIADYQKAPSWLKKLMNAYADGINYYLYKNPQVKPILLTRFQPWYPLLWTDGSISAFSTAELTTKDLENFYGDKDEKGYQPNLQEEEMSQGSNGFAFSPQITTSGKAILYINPHVTFYFRAEVHVVSEEGLNVYGAVTWGQFFVYQGFNEKCGWMHTTSNTDVSDVYAEQIVKQNDKLFYQYDNALKPVLSKNILINYLKDGKKTNRNIEAYFTHHGPVMGKKGDKWLSMKANNRSLNSLIQSWKRTKARNLKEYQATMSLLGNTSNNTVYADAEGNIAYWHGNFLPIRDTRYNWTQPIDGSTSATEWKGLHPVRESIHQINPSNGWLQNCNSTPFTMAGNNSPKAENFPFYMAKDDENFRGLNAVKLLSQPKKYDLDKVIEMGYDRYLYAFEYLVPALVKALKAQPSEYQSYIEILEKWDFYCSENSVATTLAIEWGERLLSTLRGVNIPNQSHASQVDKVKYFVEKASAQDLLKPFAETIADLKAKFGRADIAWGEVNRFQRISSDIDQKYNDDKPSLPIGFASSVWGCLPTYVSLRFSDTRKRYGLHGNSFICAVEFGKRVKAKSLLAGGQSGNMSSKNFFDQGEMYSQGRFKEVLFYKEDILKNAVREYNPGR